MWEMCVEPHDIKQCMMHCFLKRFFFRRHKTLFITIPGRREQFYWLLCHFSFLFTTVLHSYTSKCLSFKTSIFDTLFDLLKKSLFNNIWKNHSYWRNSWIMHDAVIKIQVCLPFEGIFKFCIDVSGCGWCYW